MIDAYIVYIIYAIHTEYSPVPPRSASEKGHIPVQQITILPTRWRPSWPQTERHWRSWLRRGIVDW